MTTIDDFSIFAHQYETNTNPLTSASFEELINVASYNVSAFGLNGTNYNLTLGASSNVVLEGSNMMNVYTSSNGVNHYTTSMSNGIRTDDMYYAVSQSNATTYFSTPYDVAFTFNDTFSLDTVTVTTLSSTKDTISTTKALLELNNTVKVTGSLSVDAPVFAYGTMTVSGNLMADSNFRCSKAIFGSNLNVYRERGIDGVDTVGYGFQVNTSNQLEIVKTTVFLNSNVVSKKVAVFGYNDITSTDTDDAGYLVFDELKGLGVTAGGVGGDAPVFTSGGYLSIEGGTMKGDIDMFSSETGLAYSLTNALNISASEITAEVFVTAGSDYAEYMYKSDTEASFSKGQVVGITNQGKVTGSFDESIRFMIVSDNAGIVGGNEWSGLAPSKDDEDYERFMELEQSRETIAYCGRVSTEVPKNSYACGDYLVARRTVTDGIELHAFSPSALSLSDYISSIGQVISKTDEGIPLIIVKV
jgi:hypothetical protein